MLTTFFATSATRCCRRGELHLLAQRPPLFAAKANGLSPKASGDSVRQILDRLELQPLPPAPEQAELRDLLNYYDRPFVELAYRRLLRRPMDPSAEWHVEQLRQGGSRLSALWRIRYSAEGKSRNTPFRGLQFHRAALKLARIPVLGRLLTGVAYVFRGFRLLLALPLAEQEQRQWRHHVMALFAKVEEHANESRQRLEVRAGGLDGQELD